MLLLAVNEFKFFFGETCRTVILLTVMLLTALGAGVDFLHGNYSDLKIKIGFAILNVIKRQYYRLFKQLFTNQILERKFHGLRRT